MKLFRVLAALAALCAPAGATEQSSYVWPLGTVPGANNLGALTANYYNPSLRALASCNNGPTPPANGPGGAPLLGQCWFDTSASPSIVLRYFDGSQWPGLSTLDASTHAWALSVASPVRSVVGTSDALLDNDRGKLVDVANASSIALTVAQAGAAGSFSSGWYVSVRNSGAGTATITPTTSTIDGGASIPVRPGQSLVIRSDGTNYKTDLPQQPWNANLAGIAGLTSAADKCQYWTGAGTPALMDCLSWSRAVTSAASASAGRTAFGLAIGTDVQAYNANLAALAGLTGAAGKVPYFTGPAATAIFDSTSFGRSISNAADAAALRTLAGAVIGTNVQAQDADLDCLAALSATGVVSRTGVGTCAVRAITGTANQIAVANGDGVAGPPTLSIPSNAALPGAPTTTTASPGDNSTKIATTGYADASAAAAAAPKVNASRNIAAGCGLAGGGDLSADRTLRLNLTIISQTGTSYNVVDGDCGKLITLKNAAPVAVSLPQANGSTFVSGWSVDFQNKGAGLVTITPTSSTINDGASISLSQNQGMHCRSDGANYACELGVGAGGGSGTVTSVASGYGISGGPITSSGTLSVGLSSIANSIASNIAFLGISNYVTGPTVAQGPTGIWYASGTVTVSSTTAGDGFYCKLWDGTTIAASIVASNAAANSFLPISLSGVIASPAGNIRISCVSSVAASMVANTSSNGKDSTITAFRIQ